MHGWSWCVLATQHIPFSLRMFVGGKIAGGTVVLLVRWMFSVMSYAWPLGEWLTGWAEWLWVAFVCSQNGCQWVGWVAVGKMVVCGCVPFTSSCSFLVVCGCMLFTSSCSCWWLEWLSVIRLVVSQLVWCVCVWSLWLSVVWLCGHYCCKLAFWVLMCSQSLSVSWLGVGVVTLVISQLVGCGCCHSCMSTGCCLCYHYGCHSTDWVLVSAVRAVANCHIVCLTS